MKPTGWVQVAHEQGSSTAQLATHCASLPLRLSMPTENVNLCNRALGFFRRMMVAIANAKPPSSGLHGDEHMRSR